MAMTDKDNILVEDFFKEVARQQIEDNGFTERVMEQVSNRTADRSYRLCRIWTWCCLIVGALAFWLFDGAGALMQSLRTLLSTVVTAFEVFLTTAPTADVHLNPVLILLLLAFVLIFLPYRTARRLSATL